MVLIVCAIKSVCLILLFLDVPADCVRDHYFTNAVRAACFNLDITPLIE